MPCATICAAGYPHGGASDEPVRCSIPDLLCPFLIKHSQLSAQRNGANWKRQATGGMRDRALPQGRSQHPQCQIQRKIDDGITIFLDQSFLQCCLFIRVSICSIVLSASVSAFPPSCSVRPFRSVLQTHGKNNGFLFSERERYIKCKIKHDCS